MDLPDARALGGRGFRMVHDARRGSPGVDTCPHCGAPSSGGVYCSQCGKALRGVYAPTVPAPPRPAPAPEAAAAVPVAPSQRERPIGVTLASVGFGLLAGLAVLGFVAVLAFSTVASAFADQWFDERWFPWQGAIVAFALVASVAVLLFGILSAFVAYGLYHAQAWAWVVALVIAGFAGIGNLLSLSQGELDAVLGVLVWGGLIYYFLRPEVRAYFGRPA